MFKTEFTISKMDCLSEETLIRMKLEGLSMIIVSILALIANSICLFLLQKTKSSEAHMKASMIFTSNDIIINTGVITAGVLVFFTQSKYPDLIVGAIVFLIVVRGAFRILKLGK